MIQVKVQDKYRGQKGMFVHNTELLEDEAKMAVDMVLRWGMVAVEPDGEDSLGRAKMRLTTPEELVERAFTVANLMFSKARASGLMFEAPHISEFSEEDK